MESNKANYFLFKYGLLIMGCVFLLFPLLTFMPAQYITTNGKPGAPDIGTMMDFLWIGLVLIGINLFLRKRFYYAHIGSQSIRLQNGGGEIVENWIDVESVKLLFFVFPPVYVITFRKRKGYYLFTSGLFGINILGFTLDWSEMGTLIKKKKRELGI